MVHHAANPRLAVSIINQMKSHRTLQRISIGVDIFLSLIFSYFCFFVAASKRQTHHTAIVCGKRQTLHMQQWKQMLQTQPPCSRCSVLFPLKNYWQMQKLITRNWRLIARDVNKTFFTRPRLLSQDQDQDFRNFPRPRPSLFGKDQDLHTVSDNLAKDSYKQCIWLNKVL